jgi:hypothetical protein
MVFKQIFRLAFVALVWKQYKPIIVSSVSLFAYLYLVGSIHADFLQHAELNADNSNVGLSFVAKWAALAGGIILYFVYHYFRPKHKDPAKEKQRRIEKELAGLHDKDDPFASIRTRKKLRSRADFLIEKNEK